MERLRGAKERRMAVEGEQFGKHFLNGSIEAETTVVQCRTPLPYV